MVDTLGLRPSFREKGEGESDCPGNTAVRFHQHELQLPGDHLATSLNHYVRAVHLDPMAAAGYNLDLAV
jgi:hypothetical protein